MSTENLAPQVISRLMREISQLVKNPPEGIKYSEEDNDNSVSEIYAIITGPEGTPFAGGEFKLKLVISEEYPNAPPRGYFITRLVVLRTLITLMNMFDNFLFLHYHYLIRIFHPNIANNGDICVNTLKKDWTSEITLTHVLQVIRCLLIVPFPESSLNDEAGKLFLDSYEEFASRAKLITKVHAMDGKTSGNSTYNTDESSNINSSSQQNQQISSKETALKKKEKEIKKKNLKRL